jgi:hypothetical protein
MSYADESNEEAEQSDQQKALAKQWGKRLEKALKQRKDDKVEKRYKEFRAYVRGDVGDDGEAGLVRTNIIHANFAAILPQIYAKNPEIAVTPTEAVGTVVPWVPAFCKTLQSVLGRKFTTEGRLKKRAKSAIRSAMTTSTGWMKVSWQKDVRTDPLIENRINDTQDNLQRIKYLIDEIKEDDDSRCELEAKQGELEQQIKALQQQVEVKTVSGIALDRVLTEDIFVIDDTIYDFDQYEQAEAIAHRVWMTTEQYEETFGKDVPKTSNKYGADKKESSSTAEDDKVLLVAVFEVWNKTSNTVYTLCAGADEWARDPYIPESLGKRFYPFFALAFNPIDGSVEPVSDAEMLIELQDEYNTTRTNYAEHRKENLPVRVYRKSGDLTDSDINALANRSANQWVGLEGDPTQPIERDIAILQNPPVDPNTYDVQPILRDAEMVLGAGDAAKGSINKAKTATEAEIMAQGLQSRVAERQDVVEDWIAEMAQYAAELCLQEMSAEQVQRIAGQDAVWPQMDKEQIFDLVNIEIRAGSAGRPNKAKEREQWGQMLPQIQQSVTQIAQLREQGQNDMADSMMKLMEETLRRFDERIDIESFMPAKKEEGQEPQIPPEVQQQMQQAQEQMQMLQQENEQLKQVAQGKQADMEIANQNIDFQMKKAGAEIEQKAQLAQQDAEIRLQEAQIKAEADMQSKIAIAQLNAELEREKIASQERIELAKSMMQASTQRSHMAQESAIEGEQQASEQMNTEAMNQMAEMLKAMQEAIGTMGQQFSQSLTGLHSQMNAPKRVIRDQEGNMVGVETVQVMQ